MLLWRIDPLLFYALVANAALVLALFVGGGAWALANRSRYLVAIGIFGFSQILVGIGALPELVGQRLVSGHIDRIPVSVGESFAEAEYVESPYLFLDGRLEIREESRVAFSLREDGGLLHRLSVPGTSASALLLPLHHATLPLPRDVVVRDRRLSLYCPGGLLHAPHALSVWIVDSDVCRSGWARCCGWSAEERGERITLKYGCAGCHARDEELIGASLVDIAGKGHDAETLTAALAHEGNQGPSYSGELSRWQIADLLLYLESLVPDAVVEP